jgi:two-component system alkaline phosphatase synthesis response regulator PhoP
VKGTIVVVEDEANIADLVGMYLEREGFRVLKCATGAAGLDAFKSQGPRLMVLDVVVSLPLRGAPRRPR